jgi:hypothetical protein
VKTAVIILIIVAVLLAGGYVFLGIKWKSANDQVSEANARIEIIKISVEDLQKVFEWVMLEAMLDPQTMQYVDIMREEMVKIGEALKINISQFPYSNMPMDFIK